MTKTIASGGANVLAHDEQTVGRKRLSALATYCRIYSEMQSARLACCSLLFLVLASTPIVLLTPVPLKLAVDHILLGQSIPTFLKFRASRAFEIVDGIFNFLRRLHDNNRSDWTGAAGCGVDHRRIRSGKARIEFPLSAIHACPLHVDH
jgi:hypothetical protein